MALYTWESINIVSSSAKLSFNSPELYWGFQDDVCNIAESYFSCGLVLYVNEMSVLLYVDNSVSRSPF